MKKNLYSLTLSDDVVREVDALAHRMGTNRSALVNQILAEYVSVPTPERRWNDIFEAIEELMTPTRELVPFFAPGSSTMSLKSSLSYKYRPTVKYEVDLSSGDGQTMGSLNIVFRTQSAALISAMTSFFRLWVQIEDKCLAPLLGSSISCALYDGRFVRPLAMPRGKALTAMMSPVRSALMSSYSTGCSRAISTARSPRAMLKWPTAAICEAERCSFDHLIVKNTNLR